VDELADVTITAADEEWLANFTRQLVSEGLVACGNIVPRVRSIYTWEGKVEDDTEALVILHTRRSLVRKIIERTKEEHADDVPQVIALAVSEVNPDYCDWLLKTTARAVAPTDPGVNT
jgi:periplasmic divalent cation tolerance protein